MTPHCILKIARNLNMNTNNDVFKGGLLIIKQKFNSWKEEDDYLVCKLSQPL